MAIQNHPALYTGGGVKFDSSPSVNLYGQLLAKKQAKMDALDEYDKQRINNINPNGVRDVDRPGFDQRIQQVREFYNQNKDKIRKAGTPESYNYEKMFRDISSYINQSKERTAKQEAAMKLYQERLKQDGRIPDDFINELHENDLGIDQITGVDQMTGRPRQTKSLDLTKWLSQPKPFNQQTYLKSFGDIKRTPGQPKYSPVEGAPLKLTETIEEVFDLPAKQVIAARAADKYQNSFSFAEQVKAEISDPVARKKLEDVFVQEFGTSPTQPEDYATALTMTLLQPKTAKTKTVDNKEAIMNRQEAFREKMFNLAESGRNWRAAANQSQNGLGDYDVLGRYESRFRPKTLTLPKTTWGKPETKDAVIVLDKDVDINDKKLIGDVKPIIDEKGDKYYIVREDGDWEGRDGQVISRDNVARRNMDATSMNEVKRGRLSNEIAPSKVRLPKDIKQTKISPKKDPLGLGL